MKVQVLEITINWWMENIKHKGVIRKSSEDYIQFKNTDLYTTLEKLNSCVIKNPYSDKMLSHCWILLADANLE